MLFGRGTLTKTTTIASGSATSGVCTLGHHAMAGIILPSTLDGTALTFTVSADGVTFVALDDGAGAAVGLTVAASKAYTLPDALAPWPYFKLVMGTNQSTTDTVITLVYKS